MQYSNLKGMGCWFSLYSQILLTLNNYVMRILDKALDYVRKYVEMPYINHCVVRAMEKGCPFSISFPTSTDEIIDLLEEYGQDNDLPEGWWLEYGDIDDIIEML